MTVALRLAGFEIRDSARYWYEDNEPMTPDEAKAAAQTGGGLAWGYGEGFPKSLALPFCNIETRRDHSGEGTGLKPAYEPIVVARKPLIGTVADNVLTHGVGGLNIDGCRVGGEVLPEQRAGQSQLGTFERTEMVTPERNGRWPANVLHDGCFDDEAFGRFFYCPKASKADRNAGLNDLPTATAGEVTGGRAEGSAGLSSPRAGAGRTSGAKNIHPTVKPIELMRYLCRLVTPPGGLVLDPFAGSGSTGRGALLEGFSFLGIELTAEYIPIAKARTAEAKS